MATIIESGIRGSLGLATLDNLILSPTGQILTAGLGVFGDGTSHELTISGVILSQSSSIYLSDSGTVSHEINIATSGQVVSADRAILIVGNGAQISNDGLISGDASAIRAGGNTDLVNTGTITSLEDAVSLQNSALVNNSGQIVAGGNALAAGLSAVIANSGEISGQVCGIEIETGQITNSGIISQFDSTLQTGSIYAAIAANAADGTLRVSNTGDILSQEYGIAAGNDLQLTNSGAIESQTRTAINADGAAEIENSGSIQSTDNAIETGGDLYLTNTGQISGDVMASSMRNVLLTNSGQLSSTGTGIDAEFSAFVSNSGFMESTFYDLFGFSTVSLINAGFVDVENVGTMTGAYDVIGISADRAISYSGDGTLTVGRSAFAMRDTDLLSTGDLEIQNAGTIIADQSLALIEREFDGVFDLSNTGTIDVGDDLFVGAYAGGAAILNSGNISAGLDGFIISENSTETVDASVTLQNSGTLSVGNRLLSNDDDITVQNSGDLIAGGQLFETISGGARLTNSGDIQGGSGGISANGFVDLRNTGTFDSGNGALVSSQGDVVLRNGQEGQILGFTDSNFGSTPDTTPLINGSNVVIRNDGFLDSGAAGFSGSALLDIVNSGTMNAASDLAQYGSGQAGILRNSGTMTAGQYIATSQGASVDIVNFADGQMAAQSVYNSFSDAFVRLVNHGSIATTQSIMSHGGFGFGELKVNNIGSMSSSGFAAFDTYLATANIRNQGNLQSEGALVSTEEGSINFWNTGTVTSQTGLQVNVGTQNITLRNDGTMAIEVGAVASTSGIAILTNTGTLSGFLNISQDFVDADSALITNSGTITVEGNVLSSVFVTSGNLSVTNSGSVTTSGNFAEAGDIMMVNSGDITVAETFYVDGGTGVLDLENSGTITIRKDFFSQIRSLLLDNTGDIYVEDNLGGFDAVNLDNAGTIKGGTGFNLSNALDSDGGSSSTFRNTGTIDVENGSLFSSFSIFTLTAYNGGDLNAGASGSVFDMTGGLVLRNDGVMTADVNAVNSGGTTVNVVNTGSMSAGTIAIGTTALAGTVTIRNTGDISGRSAAIFASVDQTLNLSNSGAIDGRIVGADADITNAGSITGSMAGQSVIDSANSGRLINSGTIQSSGDGVTGQFERISNASGATIEGDTAINLDNAVDLVLINNGDIFGLETNTASVAQAAVKLVGSADAYIVNHGAIAGADHGLLLEGAVSSSKIVNTGTITGTNSAAIEITDDALTGPNDHTIINRGLISGDVELADGADTFDGRGGEVDGVVLLGGGNDLGRGGDLADIFDGGAGDDDIFGGLGDDQLTGGDGRDDLFGQDGNDTLIGGAENDTLLGNDGDDLLQGGDGVDTLNGGRGDDNIQGGDGNDRLFGRDGVDNMAGGLGNDFMDGGNGDDRFVGSGGNDRIEGGDGEDISVYTGAEADYTIQVLSNGAVRVTDNRSSTPDGADVLTNIEFLQFSDGVIDVAGL